MKLSWIRIENFRNCRSIELHISQIHAIVGSNNAGKSTILKALDLLFNPSTSKISDESFWHRRTDYQIRIEGKFIGLTDNESEALKGFLKDDGSFHLARTISPKSSGNDDESTGGFEIGTLYNCPVPKHEWLIAGNISEKAINEWMKNPDLLCVNGISFLEGLPSKPKAMQWKEHAKMFAVHLTDDDYESCWQTNPKGFPNVLKANLPHFELIPAVREASEESKVLKTNPFGRLISELANNIDPTIRQSIADKLNQTTARLNRGTDNERLQGINDFEAKISSYLSDILPSQLEIEFQTPTIESLLATPKVYVDDGFRGTIDGKGHGLQRTVILSILRSYADLITKRHHAHRTLIIGFEEPELYMHPTAQRSIRSMFRKIAEGGDQILFTTHSPLLVDVTYFDEIIRVDCQKEEGLSCAKTFQIKVEDVLNDFETRNGTLKGRVTIESIRERYNHAYTPNRNEGFFAKKVILVEGPTELYCLPIYANGLGLNLDILGISVIECGGKDQIDRLYRIFNELGIPCYVVFDNDHSNKSSTKVTHELFKLFNYQPGEVEGTIIASSFTCFSKDWENEIRPQIPDYDALCGEAGRFLGSPGKPLTARFIASKVTERQPPQVPDSIDRLIRNAVNIEHKGSCLKLSTPMVR